MAENIDLVAEEFPCIVADCSFMAAYLLGGFCQDEQQEPEAVISNILSKNGQILVPPLFWYEIGNVLVNATKPNKHTGLPRISPADVADIAYDLARLPIATDLLPDTEIRSRIQQLALYHNLSYYDASYLELSHRTGFSLKTFDQALLKATKI